LPRGLKNPKNFGHDIRVFSIIVAPAQREELLDEFRIPADAFIDESSTTSQWFWCEHHGDRREDLVTRQR
jgi:hypothetical protein